MISVKEYSSREREIESTVNEPWQFDVGHFAKVGSASVREFSPTSRPRSPVCQSITHIHGRLRTPICRAVCGKGLGSLFGRGGQNVVLAEKFSSPTFEQELTFPPIHLSQRRHNIPAHTTMEASPVEHN